MRAGDYSQSACMDVRDACALALARVIEAIDRISQRYSEADLLGTTPDMADWDRPQTSASNVEFFWEVRERRNTFPPTKPRRYAVSGVPMLNRTGLHWRVNLVKQSTSYEVEPEVAS